MSEPNCDPGYEQCVKYRAQISALKAELAEAKEALEGTTETLEDEEAAHQDTLRLLTAAQARIAALEEILKKNNIALDFPSSI